MPAIKCDNCGAPLKVEPGQEIVRCTYCSTDHQLEDDDAEERVVYVQVPMPAAPAPAAAGPKSPIQRVVGVVVGIVVALIFGVVIYNFITFNSNVDKESRKMNRDFERSKKKMNDDFERSRKRMLQDFHNDPFGDFGDRKVIITDDMGGKFMGPPEVLEYIRRKSSMRFPAALPMEPPPTHP